MESVYLNKTAIVAPEINSSMDGYIKHVFCDGARFHVVSWSTLGAYCSHPRCIINKPTPKD